MKVKGTKAGLEEALLTVEGVAAASVDMGSVMGSIEVELRFDGDRRSVERLADLQALTEVRTYLEQLMPAGCSYTIKQEEEMKEEMKDEVGTLPTFAELVRRIPEISEQLLELMGYLDLWTVRSRQALVNTGTGEFIDEWDPSLGNFNAAGHPGVELVNQTVVVLELILKGREAEKMIQLVRTCESMKSKLGEKGSVFRGLERLAEGVNRENEQLRWAAARYRNIAVGLMKQLNILSATSSTWTAIRDLHEELAKEDMENVGAVFEQRFLKMAAAIEERRPDLAAELIRSLDED